MGWYQVQIGWSLCNFLTPISFFLKKMKLATASKQGTVPSNGK